MATNKQYRVSISKIEAGDDTKYPDVVSPTFKTKRNAEQWFYNWDYLQGNPSGGSCEYFIGRVR